MVEPTRITIPGAPQGFNCRLSVGGYGSRVCRVTRIGYKLEVISNEGQAANRKAFYPFVTTGSSFQMDVVHTTYEEREAFNKWLRGFVEAVVDNKKIAGCMKIEVPARRFVRTGVLVGTLDYGTHVRALAYSSILGFKGATDPMNAVGGASVEGISYYKAARGSNPNDRELIASFYPSGTQVAGKVDASGFEGTIFDTTPSPTYVEDIPLERYQAPPSGGLDFE